MIESIHLENMGPAPEMKMGLAPRLNLITGDNGLGKSFLLDVAWWVLTQTWARHPIIPTKKGASISYSYTKRTPKPYTYTSNYSPASERWSVDKGRQASPALILYAQVDGGFSVWDPARNFWKDGTPHPNAYLFSAPEVWAGNQYCEGLLRDWGSWQREDGFLFKCLSLVLRVLSPSNNEEERLRAGDLRKLTVNDPLRYPTLRMPTGEDVAVIHASAGMRRVIALAYLLIWAWEEHLASAKVRGEPPAREVVFLIDEIEAHLHPQWQRRIVPALLQVMQILTGQNDLHVQLVAVTHSPLIMASVEPLFDADQDAWFDLDRTTKPCSVELTPRVFDPKKSGV